MNFQNVMRLQAAGLVVFLAGCAGPGGGEDVRVAPIVVNANVTVAGPAKVPEWRRTELYFGLRYQDETGGMEDRGAWSEARWQKFLDEMVTPEFPEGFSVLDAYGQWKNSEDGNIHRLISKVVVVLHEAVPEADERIEKVRAEFKKITGQESVLRSTHSAAVAF